MEFYYLSKYPIELCKEYMTHFNIYDRFVYTWEEKGDYYLITFKEFRNSGLSLSGVPRPVFKVIFEDFGERTGIRVKNINPHWIVKTPTVSFKEIDRFWEVKLDAKRIEQYYLSKYPIGLCKEYMTHFSVYDRFVYTWEERGEYYLITFKEYRNSKYSFAHSRKPIFKVVFEDFGEQTGIWTQFMNPGFIITWPAVPKKDIDYFWEVKLNARRIWIGDTTC